MSHRVPLPLMCALVLSAACGGEAPPPAQQEDGGSEVDAGSTDAGAADAGQAGTCVAGSQVACSTLGGSWAAGSASCRADGSGFDVSACSLAVPGQIETVKAAQRAPERHAAARCNDGSPFTFEIRVSPTRSKKWFIYMEGGGMCDDRSRLCSARELALTTTMPDADRTLKDIAWGGFLGNDAVKNPDFHDANQVFGQYCSSDLWSGATDVRRPSSGDPAKGWYFSGGLIVEHMLAMLEERYGLDDGDPQTKVMFGGGSAGAFGTHTNAHRVEAALPATAQAGRLFLLVDAGWMTDWDDPNHRFSDATVPDREMWRAAHAFWAARFEPACEAARPNPGDCIMAPYWYPALASRLPVFIQQSEFDSSFTAAHSLRDTDPAAATWRTQVRSSLGGVSWLFSGSTSYHTRGRAYAGIAFGPSGKTLREVVGRFFAGATPERVEF